MAWPYRLYGGAQRPDAISGLDRRFSEALVRLYNAAPPEVQRELGLNSGYRSAAVQQQLWDKSDKSGHSVAAPGRSKHQFGTAADLYGFGLDGNNSVSQGTKDWVRANAQAQGLYFPMGHEPWHIQLRDSRASPDGGVSGDPGYDIGVSGGQQFATDPSLANTLAEATNPDPLSKALNSFASAAAGGLGKSGGGGGGSLTGGTGQEAPAISLETPEARPPEGSLGTPGVQVSPPGYNLADIFQVKGIGGAEQPTPFVPPKRKWV